MDSDQNFVQQYPPRRPRPIRRFFRRYGIWITIVSLVICGAGFFTLGRYSVYHANPQLAGQEQANEVLIKVSKLIQLPQNETPTMATITNAASLRKTQPFLVNAENGDVLIVYANAKTALLYRPSTDKLIAVGPVSTGSSADSSAQEPASATSPSAAATTNASSHEASTTTSGN